MPFLRRIKPPTSAGELITRLVVASGLAIDAYVHVDLAHTYAEVSGGIGEGNLFRLEAIVSALVAAAALLIGNRMAYAAGLIVGVSAAVLAVIATNTPIGPFGPIPDLYDPVWYPEKTLSVVAEVVAAVGSSAGLLLVWRSHGRRLMSDSPRRRIRGTRAW